MTLSARPKTHEPRIPGATAEIEVIYHTRRPTIGQASLERVFAGVGDALPSEFKPSFRAVPRTGVSLRSIVENSRSAARHVGDVNHITGDIHYVAGALPSHSTVLTIPDCVLLDRMRGIRGALYRMLWYVAPMRRVRLITAISHATKDELRQRFPRISTPIEVVHCPLLPQYVPTPTPANEVPVVLHIGTNSNKNLPRVVEALRGLPCRLELIGRLSPEVMALLESSQVPHRARQALSDEEVLQAYRDADLVSFPSTYEGFGLPIIEANGIGRPVLTSRLAPMTEVAADAAHLVDPYDVDSIRQGFLRLLEDAAYREDLVRRGFENVERFRPREIAAAYGRLYHQVSGR